LRRRHVRTGITLAVLMAVLAAGAWFGTRSLFAPIPDDRTVDASPACATRTLEKGQRINSRQVVVNVYNAGTRAGLADKTMGALTRRGFDKGSVGNAPEGSRVKVAQVWTNRRRDTAARLVAQQFGPTIKVKLKRVDLGPGVDVVVGNGFESLAAARRSILVETPQTACLPTPSPRG
jgi:hypothetical protein